MSGAKNTLFMRLAGPMQSWGTSSRLQLRRTDDYPSKSGVLGMLLCAMGVRRENSTEALKPLASLTMGVRVDRPGTLDWDYHTAGAKIGIRSAAGKIKETSTTGEYETLLSRRQYLFDASFLVALQGDADQISACARALENPIWPVFLGRKCCVPSEPIFVSVDSRETLSDALASVPWKPRIDAIDRPDWSTTRTLDTFIEHPPGSRPPDDARLVHDLPRVFGYYGHDSRWVMRGQVTASVGEATQKPASRPDRRWVDYTSEQWKKARRYRMELDNYLCVFCKSPAKEVHHIDYANAGRETNADLRSLCEDCHDACTMLEYGRDMRNQRIDPSDPGLRPMILGQIKRLHDQRRVGHKRELMKRVRALSGGFFADLPDSWTKEVR